jgi:hypothetical protein
MSAQTDRPDDSNMGARVFWLGRVSEAATDLSTLSSRRVPIPLSGTTDTSKISLGPTSELPVVRKFSFNPNVTPARSHLGSISKVTLIVGVVAILAVALTAVTDGGQFTLADIWRRLAIDRTFELASVSPSPVPKALATRDEPSITRLVVQTARGPAGEPVPLGLTVRGPANGAIVHIKGLMPGMELSTGNAVGSDAWQISATDLGDAWIAPPEGFVGSADLVAELRLSDDKIVDRQGIKLEWGPPISPEPAPRQFEREEIVAGPTIAREPTQPQPDQEEAGPRISPEPTVSQYGREEPAPPISTVPATRQLDREEIAVLLKRGKDLIATGDLAAARLVLKRAADANDVEATLALAATYDPYVLRELKVYSFAADTGMARAWYEKAKQLGSALALRRLEMLATGAR